METQPKPLNIPLIVFTFVVAVFGETVTRASQPTYHSPQVAMLMGVFALVLSPVFIVWARALWNTLLPRITGRREITFWEAASFQSTTIHPNRAMPARLRKREYAVFQIERVTFSGHFLRPAFR
jgi:hypothetical protein